MAPDDDDEGHKKMRSFPSGKTMNNLIRIRKSNNGEKNYATFL